MDHAMLAIVEALQHWHPYLHGKKFVMQTDHHPLMYFLVQLNLSPRQLYWDESLVDFLPWYYIQYT